MIRHVANKGLRRRLMFIFSTSVVTTIVSLVHAAYILRTGGTRVLIAAIVEVCPFPPHSSVALILTYDTPC